jgi:general stress protein YciG
MAQQSSQKGGGNRGFASMDEERQREIASQGGRAAHEAGTAHEFTSEEAREAGRKGGEAVSRDREHMAEIGAEGGRNSRSGGSSSGGGSSQQRGGSSEQHAEAGRQSHKND